MTDSHVVDLAEPDWARIATEFHAERSVGLTRELLESCAIEADDIALLYAALESAISDDEEEGASAPLFDWRDEEASRAKLRACLTRLWDAASREGGSRFALALGAYAEVQRAWELSADTDPMEAQADLIEQTWSALPAELRRDDEGRLTAVLVQHHANLVQGFAMENGLMCSCALETGTAADQVGRRSTELLAELESLDVGGAWTQQRDLVRRILTAHELYFQGVKQAADTVIDQVVDGVGPEHVREVADRLWRDQRSEALGGDVYRSELRAHALSLYALADRLESSDLGRLTFPGASATYIFPFTIRGATEDLRHDNHELLEAVMRRWRLSEAPARASAKERRFWPLRARHQELSDIWSRGRATFSETEQDETAYTVVSLEFPDVVIDPRHEDSPEIGPLRLSVRLSSFGNHYVRITGPVRSPGVDRRPGYHELNQAIRRGSAFMGAERVRIVGDDGTPFDSLGDLAHHLVKEMSDWDDELGIKRLRCTFDGAIDGHTVLNIKEALINGRDGGPEREATGADIIRALGPMVLVPVERTAAGLEEWLRYDGPADPTAVPNFMGEVAPTGSLAVQTPRSTCLYVPGLPDWSTLGTNEMIEFAVSVRALARQWLRHLQDLAEDAGKTLLDGEEPGAAEPRDSDGVRRQRLNLASQAAHIRQQRALLHSEELARSPGHRAILNRLLEANQAELIEAEVDRWVGELDSLYVHLGDAVAAEEEQRTERYQQAVELVLFFLAVFALADLFSYVNDMIYPDGIPRALAWAELTAYALGVLGLGCWAWWAQRRSRGDDGADRSG